MPRDGSGVASQPANTRGGPPNTPISSTKYNSVVDDVYALFNSPAPIAAGGTNASTVAGARASLGVENKTVYAAKSADYTALAADNNAILRFTAAATLSLTAAAILAANWHVIVIADGGDVTVDPNGSETIDGTATLVVPNGGAAYIVCSGSAFYTNKAAGQAAAIANMKWRSRFIGEIVYANTAVTGAEIPPSTVTDTVWIELTSGLTGVGQFNNAKLTSESISGSAPLVLATAVINYAGSPMNGQTVSLLNTESRILRPSTTAGTLQNDAFQGHRHGLSSSVFTGGAGSLGTSSGNTNPLTITDPITDGTNGTPRTANETRMKNIGVKAYMRIA